MRAAIALLLICGACDSPRPQPQPDLTIRLHSGFIRGRVVEKETGAPLANRRYRWIYDARPARTAALAGRIERLTTTDAQGRYRMQAPPAQPGIVSFWVEDDQGWRILRSTDYFYGAQPAEDRPEEVSARTRDIRLRVLDIGEQPIKGAEVRLVIRGEGGPVPDVAPFLTGADGTVRTGRIELGGYWADVSAPGYATARMCPYQYDIGDERFIDVVLEKSIRISGRFLDYKDRAPDGLQVAVGYVCKPKVSWYSWFVHVDKHGRFTADVPEGEEFQVQWTVSGQAHDTFRHYVATRSPDGRVVCRDTTDD